MTELPLAIANTGNRYGNLDFDDTLNTPNQTERILKQSEFQVLRGYWKFPHTEIDLDAIANDEPVTDFFVGILIGMALLLESRALMDVQQQNRACEFNLDEPELPF